ncbi:DNA repair protein RadA [Patescibacteria group bacterium]|nr:DNA repair protein RadA [Patescibacteria group bacterium]MBU1663171.1 DNA repair protein RadA [Patescibacteria group bacterium]MBU1933841.1 DNA repair protein RadA [Patescibacteria group bacterium]MBU2008087.1 DNA repair protein RadA [Patescibacteria group bacterium]MBU2233609.1 DNA repair protein RadA [Patescibacteria group bacterium]
MSNKISTIYVCSNCDAQFPKWSGRCLECGGWGALQTQTIDLKAADKIISVSPAEVINLEKLDKQTNLDRLITNIQELDRVLGNGIMPGSLILLGGEPGIGKSTMVAQIAQTISQNNEVIYVSGEESANQIKNRFDRLSINAEKIKFLSETNVEKIISTVNQLKPGLVIIDSIQTIYSSAIAGEAGSINQIRGSAISFLETAKKNNIAIILIGHITKDGLLAGPKSLEHIVDTVLYLETETNHDYRILRATKNRFGSTNEIGIFEMTASGFKQVPNPSLIFIEKNQEITGSVISCIIQGTRSFLIEVQALVTKTVFGYPQRKASGFDLNRLQVLIAVMTKRAGLNLTNQDVILNVVGGLKINDPGLDLAVCIAVASSVLNQVIKNKNIVLGEVGLGGEIRQITRLEQRLNEAERLGFAKAIIPDSVYVSKKIKLIKIKNLAEIIKYLAQD